MAIELLYGRGKLHPHILEDFRLTIEGSNYAVYGLTQIDNLQLQFPEIRFGRKHGK